MAHIKVDDNELRAIIAAVVEEYLLGLNFKTKSVQSDVRLVNLNTAARYLGITPKTFKSNYVTSGLVKPVCLGEHANPMYDLHDINKIIDYLKNGGKNGGKKTVGHAQKAT